MNPYRINIEGEILRCGDATPIAEEEQKRNYSAHRKTNKLYNLVDITKENKKNNG